MISIASKKQEIS